MEAFEGVFSTENSNLSIDTPPKTNTDPPKKRFLIGISFSRGPFSVAMLVLEGCKC